MAGSIFIPLVSVFDGKGITQAKSQMAGLTVVLRNLKATAAAAAISFATVGAGNFIQESVAAARDLDRNLVGLEGVFTSMSDTMKQFTVDAQDIGLSQVDAARASTFLGSVLKQSGFTMEETANQTKNLVGLASDLAATYGYDVSEALTGMTALFRGEYDPIEKFGVAMKQAEVNALLAARGQNKLTGAALRQATAQARLDILYQRSQDAQGAFARQSDSLFVKQKQLSASFDNLKASLGASLTGPLAKLLSVLQPIIEKIGPHLTPIFENFSKVVEMLTPLIEPLSEIFMALWGAISPLIEVLISLIKPIMVPLVAIFKLFAVVLKPFIPLIEFIARLIGAILVPVLTVLLLVVTLAVKALEGLFTSLASIPFIGDFFKEGNTKLKEFTDGMNGLNDKLLETKGAGKGLIDQLSKDIPSNSIDGVTNATNDLTTSIKSSIDALNDLIDNARNVQKSLISAFDISGILEDNTQKVVESVVYVEGKFKTIVSGVSKVSNDIVGSFSNNLMKMKTFYRNFNALIAQNLDPELLAQIVSAGPDAGNATAEAILASGEEGIKGLNKTFSGIRRLAGDIGVKLAKQMQKVGKRMGNGLLDGLIAERDNLVAQAKAIGEAMGDALGRSFVDEGNRMGIQNLKETVQSIKNSFVGSQIAGLPSGTNLAALPSYQRPNLFNARQLMNPFKEGTQRYSIFEDARAKAIEYNISINVAPGANGVMIGRTLVSAIQEYERVAGNTWRR